VSRAPDHVGSHRFEDEPRRQDADAADGATAQSWWQWLAVGLLLVCWIAEASMCADRGF
jgi:hypothetical protein